MTVVQVIKIRTGGLLSSLDVSEVLLGKREVERDGGRLDGDTALLLIGAGVGVAGIAGLGGGDNTRFSNERVRKSRLAVVDVLLDQIQCEFNLNGSGVGQREGRAWKAIASVCKQGREAAAQTTEKEASR